MKYITNTLLLITIIIIILISIWAVIFSAYVTAFIAFVFILSLLPIQFYTRRRRLSSFVIAIVILLITITSSIYEVNNKIQSLASIPRTTKTLNQFSTRDKVSIYGLNIIMGVLTYPIYPEVAKETLMMMIPTEDGVRVFHSDFALKSTKIQNLLKNFKKQLKNSQATTETLEQRISWNVSHYVLGSNEARYALALNPSVVTLSAVREGFEWKIDVKIRVKVIYPQNCNITLISYPNLQLEEGLIWVLQELQWLHPYTAEWNFSILSNDSRLN